MASLGPPNKEMKKSKKDQYLEKLQKWRLEKEKEKENRQILLSGKKEVKEQCQPNMSAKKMVTASLKKSTKALPEIQKIMKKQTEEESKMMMQKLEKWKEAKGKKSESCSTKKQALSVRKKTANIERSATKPVVPPLSTSKYKTVKSRLFDFQQKQKKEPSHVDSAPTDQSGKKKNLNREQVKNSILKEGSDRCTVGVHDVEEGDDNVFTDTVEAPAATPLRNVRFTSPENKGFPDKRLLRKTPSVRKAALEDWIKAKGKTPSKFRHLMCFHGEGSEEDVHETQSQTKCALSVDELEVQLQVMEFELENAKAMAKLESMLDECMTLFEAGCPGEAIIPWLNDIYSTVPLAKSSAKFYVCKAKVIRSTGDLETVLQLFEDALINNAQPREDVAKCMTETVKYMMEERERQAQKRVRRPSAPHVQQENVFQSSAIVYTVTEATPLSQKKSSSRKRKSSGCHVVTPVRRSTRRSLQFLPASLQNKSETFSTLQEVTEGDMENIIYRPNTALESNSDQD